MRVLVTGAAGFIGFHVARRLIADGHEVTGVDGMTPYYDVSLKEARHALLKRHNAYAGHQLMLEDAEGLMDIAAAAKPEVIIHLAAQAGVRYSLEAPRSYVDANVVGTFNVMEAARVLAVKHLMIASTSSVYGANTKMPFRETDQTDHPLTLYAATKKATEAMTHAYSHLWGLPTTAFRFFTVYGPWGRPDMALFKFAEALTRDEPIDVYNAGDMARDFTFIDDLAEAVVRLMGCVPEVGKPAPGGHDSLSPAAPWRVVNIGRSDPVRLDDFIAAIEDAVGRKARRNELPMQPGDPQTTFAACDLLADLTGYRPSTSVREGVAAFWAWLQTYRNETSRQTV
ncbi:MAG TPA: SDR family NAD(P)-dependent oxidoreductase [Caulobacteraceae bacterium]|nr:SDR family NAD(P)-dependent oxidoreductase [Caulobacteraceae bacterium]